MRAKTIFFLLLITLLLTSAVNARSRYPKREFRGCMDSMCKWAVSRNACREDAAVINQTTEQLTRSWY